ncbi:hypothetical protein ACQJBY_065804 [Aegilops geniculata]
MWICMPRAIAIWPHGPPRASAAPVRSAATLPRCPTRALHAVPQTTASALRCAPVPDRPSARPPARGRCSAAPRSRAQPRPRARLSCTRAAAPWLRARGARRTRRRQRGPEQPRGEVLRPHHGRHRPPRQDLSTGQPDEVVIIKDDDADTVGPSRLPSPTPAASWSSPSRWRVRSRAAAPAAQQRCSRSRMAPTTASHPAPTSAVAPPPGRARQEILSPSVIRPVSRRWGVSADLRCGFGIEVTRELLDLFISSSRSPLSTRFDQVGAALRGHMHALGI